MARAFGAFRGRALLIAGALSLFVVLGTALTNAWGDAGAREDPAERIVLRLHDLPTGFFPFGGLNGFGREFTCEPLQPAKPPRKVASVLRRFSPAGCWGLYLPAYQVPGIESPSVAGTGALDAGTAAATASVYSIAPQVLGDLTEEESRKVATPEIVGEATQLFHWADVPPIFEDEYQRGSFVVWRSGDVVAATFAATDSFTSSDRIAYDLARRQQVHIESPTPYTAGERDASEVGLDDPALKLPIHWLGRDFDPGRGLPPTHLEGGGTPPGDYGLPGQKAVVRYSGNLTLSAWTKAGWERFLKSPASKRLRRCAKLTQLTLVNGQATVFAGPLEDGEVCPGNRPDHYFAIAEIEDTVTTVNLAGCKSCPVPVPGPYNSLKGMKAIVRGLTLRPEPVYPAPAQP